eukprot:3816102-Prymnesium_polylepis.1
MGTSALPSKCEALVPAARQRTASQIPFESPLGREPPARRCCCSCTPPLAGLPNHALPMLCPT